MRPERGFQSTLPLRGATFSRRNTPGRQPISIHAPLTGSDSPAVRSHDPLEGFQSTLPLRGATVGLSLLKNKAGISIHAPLTGSDYFTKD